MGKGNTQEFNRFILYYTIRDYWKGVLGNKMGDLYSLLFPTQTGGNRSLYDVLLRGDSISLDKWLDDLESRSGVSKDYWSGKMQIATQISDYNWGIFFEAKGKRRKNASREYIQEEDNIKRELRSLYSNKGSQSSTLNAILHFLEFKSKKKDYTIAGRLEQIENEIESLHPKELHDIESERLKEYLTKLNIHARRISSVIELKEWKIHG